MTDRLAALRSHLGEPVDGASLAVFRVAVGLLVAVSGVRFLAHGWVTTLFTAPTFRFHYPGFEWVPYPGPQVVHGLFVALVVLGVMVAAGVLYRASVVLLFLTFSWLQLLDVSTYLNHYYLVCLLLGLLALMPVGAVWSVDARLFPGRGRSTVPRWCLWLLRAQVAVVYVHAGLAKLTPDWLLYAQPLNLWLSARTSTPVVGPLLDTRTAAYLFSWGGFLFDTTIAGFLQWRRTRPAAYLAVVGFHLATAALFPIGMFPFIMITAALVFFSPGWPRRLVRSLPPPPGAALARPMPVLAVVAGLVYVAVQAVFPLRTHLHGGNVSWHEQGMRFSWRVMTREKNGSVTYRVRSPSTGREWLVSPRRYLTGVQERELSVQPDLILQLAHHIGAEHRAAGHPDVEVRADVLVSLNGRPAQRLVDGTVDLMRLEPGNEGEGWILPAPSGPPPALTAAR